MEAGDVAVEEAGRETSVKAGEKVRVVNAEQAGENAGDVAGDATGA